MTADKLEAEEIADVSLKGKMALYARITPSDDLVAYSKCGGRGFQRRSGITDGSRAGLAD